MDLREAIRKRLSLLEALPETDCYRLFHGIAEGVPGLTLDRYGPILLVQTWRDPLPFDPRRLADQVADELGVSLQPVWNHRNKPRKTPFSHVHSVELPDDVIGRELGVRYHVHPRHAGLDPLLFLDFRPARRLLRQATGSVLNLFAYTCGIGVCAAVGGADEVVNVDFAASALRWGEANSRLNQVSMGFVQADVFPVIRQLAGLPVGRKRPSLRLEPRQFDWVILDPPRWARSPYGAVDIVRDYQSLFKPAWLACRGTLLATNNAAEVHLDDWLQLLKRCAQKVGKPIVDLQVLSPEPDFPSFDGRAPLKMAVIRG